MLVAAILVPSPWRLFEKLEGRFAYFKESPHNDGETNICVSWVSMFRPLSELRRGVINDSRVD